MFENTPSAVTGVAGFFTATILDKMMDDRKHLTAGEVDKLLTATKGTRNEAREDVAAITGGRRRAARRA